MFFNLDGFNLVKFFLGVLGVLGVLCGVCILRVKTLCKSQVN